MAAANFAYEIKNESGVYAEPPPELLIGFDWLKFNTPPSAGGLRDQPLLLIHRIKIALNTYDAVKAYRDAHNLLKDEALSQWYGANSKLIRFMEFIWNLQGSFDG